ncbi:MAG: 50S ribosomal protein L13 [Phycisphaerales bacterium]|nr:50S ribosomal protein L13 [Phycisphaerales bacterium]
MRQTYFAKPGEVEKQWHIIDGDGQRLGRMAVQIATILMGKHRPDYTPHIDTGDFVIVTNAAKVTMTGNKMEQRIKTRYSGYPGGLKAESYKELMERRPEFVVEDAVRRMLPKGRLGRQMLKKLKVYRGDEHPHAAQQPVALTLS